MWLIVHFSLNCDSPFSIEYIKKAGPKACFLCSENGVTHTEVGGLSHIVYPGLSHTDYVVVCVAL